MQEENRDQEEFREKVLKQFLSGGLLMGKNGALTPLLKEFLETALEAEMKAHLCNEKQGRLVSNKRNTHTNKRQNKQKNMLGLEQQFLKLETFNKATEWYSKAFETNPYFNEPYGLGGFNI